jgi:hypothetical protein
MRIGLLPIIVFATLAAACGGSSSSSSPGGGNTTCTPGSNCGGDIVGRWNMTSPCIIMTGQVPFGTCAQPATMRMTDVQATGYTEYRSDGTYTGSATISGTMLYDFPAVCLTVQGITITCAQLNQAMQAQPADAGMQAITCYDGAAGGCTCSAAMAPTTSGGAGTYTTANGVLTETFNGSTTQSTYCVEGTKLTDTAAPRTTNSSGVQMTMSGTVVYTKQ